MLPGKVLMKFHFQAAGVFFFSFFSSFCPVVVGIRERGVGGGGGLGTPSNPALKHLTYW